MAQFTLKLALDPVYSAQNFTVSECNAQAHRLVTQWPNWPAHVLVVYGAAGTGKTHLGHIWAAQSGARRIEAKDFTQYEPGENLWVEDIEKLVSQEALFHAFNDTRERGKYVLLTARRAPQHIAFSLPDLASRLRAAPSVSLSEPDDAMLEAALRKQFADRQLKVEEEVIAYLSARMERSFAAASHVVEALDMAAMQQRRSLTVPFVRRVLEGA